MNWMRRMMAGRYGVDQLNMALLALYFIFYLLTGLFHAGILEVLSFGCLLAACYRTFSRQLERRRMENEQFLDLVRPIVRQYNVNKCRRQDKEHCYFKCPNCGQQLRVPKGKGKISITCRNCGVSFEKKT